MAINVKPLGDRVLVQPLEEKEVQKEGIIIPDTARGSPAADGASSHGRKGFSSELIGRSMRLGSHLFGEKGPGHDAR